MSTFRKIADDTEKAHKVLEKLNERNNIVSGKENNTNTAETNEVQPDKTAEKILIADLMEKNGVVAEDFQAVCDENPEIIYAVGGGKTCSDLAKSADRVVTRYRKGRPMTGKCLPGTRTIYDRADCDSLSCTAAREAIVESRLPYQKTNGGGNGYFALEASGDYLSVAIENKAYGLKKFTPEYQEMNDLMNEQVNNVQPGITITIDSIEDNNVRVKAGNTKGGKYGHIAVKRNDGNWACDFVQDHINFSRYGKYARICVPKDAEISSEYAQLLIEQAKKRQQEQLITQQIIAAKANTNAN